VSAADPFPSARFGELLRHLPRYAKLAWVLGRDQRLSRSRRAALLAGAAYLASPIDFVPGIIPVAGQLDDAAAVLVALRVALAGLPVADRQAVLADAGLEPGVLERDLRTVGATYGWLARQGARLAWRGSRAVARASARMGSRLAARLRRPAEPPDRGGTFDP
jgi:uncharacterized membrane protein YkvA (DUF1232 family)